MPRVTQPVCGIHPIPPGEARSPDSPGHLHRGVHALRNQRGQSSQNGPLPVTSSGPIFSAPTGQGPDRRSPHVNTDESVPKAPSRLRKYRLGKAGHLGAGGGPAPASPLACPQGPLQPLLVHLPVKQLGLAFPRPQHQLRGATLRASRHTGHGQRADPGLSRARASWQEGTERSQETPAREDGNDDTGQSHVVPDAPLISPFPKTKLRLYRPQGSGRAPVARMPLPAARPLYVHCHHGRSHHPAEPRTSAGAQQAPPPTFPATTAAVTLPPAVSPWLSAPGEQPPWALLLPLPPGTPGCGRAFQPPPPPELSTLVAPASPGCPSA